MTVTLALLTLAVAPAAAQADGGQSITQPASGAQTVSQTGQCIAQSGAGQALTQGTQAQAQGAGAGACTAAPPVPSAPVVGGPRFHSKILRSHRHPAGQVRRHQTR